MKRYAVMFALGLMLAMPNAASAETLAPGGGGAPTIAGGTTTVDPAKFQEHKTKILQRMAERRTCVEAAQTPDALRGCMPKGMHGGGHDHHAMMQGQGAPGTPAGGQ